MRFSVVNLQQKGTALLVTLVVLLALSIVGASALSSSAVDLKVSRNVSDIIKSNQQADAGIDLVMSLAGENNDPFIESEDVNSPFENISNSRLEKLNDLNGTPTVEVSTAYNVLGNSSCGRSDKGNSIRMIRCEHYLVTSAVTFDGNDPASPTVVFQGVRREIIGR